jgi:hypothetical protein
MSKPFKFPISGLSKNEIWLNPANQFLSLSAPPKSRVLYAASHVVADPFCNAMGRAASIDWETTMAIRRNLWGMGLGIADAMDTSQRGMGVSWENVKELLTRTMKEAKIVNGHVASGVGTDQLPYGQHSLNVILNAYLEQLEFTISQGAKPVIMCSRELASSAKSANDYLNIYSKLLSQSEEKVILHWLGTVFDPQLAGYWGSDDFNFSKETVLELISINSEKIDGIKISLLNKEWEIEIRNRLPKGVKLYTGDDFNYTELIKGDITNYSHALLGAFSFLGSFAAGAVRALDKEDFTTYEKILKPTENLSREVFKAPTFYYKTGVVWLSYLNGLQNHFSMIGGIQSARSVNDLCELFILANDISLFSDPDLALYRMKKTLDFYGANL